MSKVVGSLGGRRVIKRGKGTGKGHGEWCEMRATDYLSLPEPEASVDRDAGVPEHVQLVIERSIASGAQDAPVFTIGNDMSIRRAGTVPVINGTFNASDVTRVANGIARDQIPASVRPTLAKDATVTMSTFDPATHVESTAIMALVCDPIELAGGRHAKWFLYVTIGEYCRAVMSLLTIASADRMAATAIYEQATGRLRRMDERALTRARRRDAQARKYCAGRCGSFAPAAPSDSVNRNQPTGSSTASQCKRDPEWLRYKADVLTWWAGQAVLYGQGQQNIDGELHDPVTGELWKLPVFTRTVTRERKQVARKQVARKQAHHGEKKT